MRVGDGRQATGAFIRILAQFAAAEPARALPALASAFGTTFWVAFGLAAASLAPALALPGAPGRRTAGPAGSRTGPRASR